MTEVEQVPDPSPTPSPGPGDPSPTPDAPAAVVDKGIVEDDAVDMEEAPARSASDAYVFAALLCAVVGIIVPIVPAAAALMLLRATDEDLTGEPLRPQLSGVASFARGLAWFDLAWMTAIVAILLLGILGRVISS